MRVCREGEKRDGDGGREGELYVNHVCVHVCMCACVRPDVIISEVTAGL